MPLAAERYTLSAHDPQSGTVQLNGADMALAADGDLPKLAGVAAGKGKITLPAASITFLAVSGANNATCR